MTARGLCLNTSYFRLKCGQNLEIEDRKWKTICLVRFPHSSGSIAIFRKCAPQQSPRGQFLGPYYVSENSLHMIGNPCAVSRQCHRHMMCSTGPVSIHSRLLQFATDRERVMQPAHTGSEMLDSPTKNPKKTGGKLKEKLNLELVDLN